MNTSHALRVRNARIVRLQVFKDFPDGNLFIAESRKQVPFRIERVYFINSLANPKAVRGKHAHRKVEQLVFCVSGSFVLHLDDGSVRQKLTLTHPAYGIWLGPLLWHTMTSFSYDCVILALASAPFDESDYFRDYDDFLKHARSVNSPDSK
jgi:dTDP-4-dehydrorhamnose 3,5-epimerase-like enzyme